MLLGAGCTGGDARAYMDCGGRCYFPSTTASTTLSIASVTRLVGRLKLFVRIEKANCSQCLVVTYPERLFTPPRAPAVRRIRPAGRGALQRPQRERPCQEPRNVSRKLPPRASTA